MPLNRDYCCQPCVGVVIVHCYTLTQEAIDPQYSLCTDHSLSLERLFKHYNLQGPPLSSETESRLSNPSPLYRFWAAPAPAPTPERGLQRRSPRTAYKGSPYCPGLHLSPAPSPSPALRLRGSPSKDLQNGVAMETSHMTSLIAKSPYTIRNAPSHHSRN